MKAARSGKHLHDVFWDNFNFILCTGYLAKLGGHLLLKDEIAVMLEGKCWSYSEICMWKSKWIHYLWFSSHVCSVTVTGMSGKGETVEGLGYRASFLFFLSPPYFPSLSFSSLPFLGCVCVHALKSIYPSHYLRPIYHPWALRNYRVEGLFTHSSIQQIFFQHLPCGSTIPAAEHRAANKAKSLPQRIYILEDSNAHLHQRELKKENVCFQNQNCKQVK